MATVRARSFEYAVTLDAGWDASSDRGGAQLPNDDANWTPEHLLLTALCRCTLTSLRYHARRAGLEPETRGGAHGVVTRCDDDGRFAFAGIEVELDVRFGNPPGPDSLRELLGKAERDCFVGASLRVEPIYSWTVDDEPLA